MLIKQIKIRLISKFHKFISFIINFIIAQALVASAHRALDTAQPSSPDRFSEVK